MAFFHWFCQAGFREEIEGDLLEQFHKRSKQYSARRNRLLFIRDVIFLFRFKLIGNFSRQIYLRLLPTTIIAKNVIAKNVSFIIIVLIPIWIASFFLLSFIKSKGCNQFVIDSYEIRSGIDIPGVDFFNCYYNEEQNVRLSVWQLKGDASSYLRTHGRKFIPIHLDDLRFDLPLVESEKPEGEQLYISAGSRWGNTWQYVIEKESGKMWIEMKYTPTLLASGIEMFTTILFYSIPLFLLILLLLSILKMLYLKYRKPKVIPI